MPFTAGSWRHWTFSEERDRGAGDRSQKSGDRSQETGNRSQGSGDRSQETGVRNEKKSGWSLFLIGLQSGEELHVPSFRAVAAYFNENSACVGAGFNPAPTNFHDKWPWQG
uniref:Uncharacterized protein n=1 Tax=Desulfatirhabdium butyrativorans TaxID=340467 RepID=A0A7C4RTF3_9BACT